MFSPATATSRTVADRAGRDVSALRVHLVAADRRPVLESFAEERENPELVPGTLVNQRNFGMVRVSGPRTERALTLEAYDAGGGLLWQRRIAAAELR